MRSNKNVTTVKMTAFSKAVIATIKKIPRGKVATYGQIARLAGKPGGARGVGWILNSCTESHDLPWQRVLNSAGKISFPQKSSSFARQRSLLMKEGVQFKQGDRAALDLKTYQWKKEPRKRKNTPSLFSQS